MKTSVGHGDLRYGIVVVVVVVAVVMAAVVAAVVEGIYMKKQQK